MEWTYGLLALILGAVLGVGAVIFAKQKKTRKVVAVIGAVGLIAGILSLVVTIPFLSNSLIVQTTTPPPVSIGGTPSTPIAGSCPVEGFVEIDKKCVCLATDGDSTVRISATDPYLSTAVGGTHRYRINGDPALTVADAGTFTASPGDEIEILFNNATTTGAYGLVQKVNVPCSGTKTFSAKTAVNGTLTFRYENSNGQLITSGTNQTLAAGDVKNVKMEIEGQYQKDFPNGFVLVVEVNKTVIDEITVADRTTNVELSSGSIPQTHSTTYATESLRKAYILPSVISNEVDLYTVTIDVDDTINPSVDAGDVKFSLFPLNYYINDKNGGAFEGPSAEDEYNVVTHSGPIASTLDVD